MWFSFFITWEQRKFGEVFTYERPDRYIVASDKYSDYYSTPVLTANKGFILGYTNEQRTYNHPCVIFDDFTLDSKYVDFPFMVKSSALKILTAKQGYYLPFAYELLHAANIEVLGHARHYISVVQPTAVLVPNYPEQLRIGKFIEAIDNLITLHQRKQNCIMFRIFLRKLLQKMTIAWEQRKLGELISVTINAGIKKFNELGRFDTKPEDLSKYKRVEVGDIAYNSMRMWQGASGYSPYSGILSPAYTVISPKTGVSSLFFSYLIKRPQMVHLFEINSQGLTSDTWNLKFPAFSKIEASAPLDIDEQENISELFTVLDNLITLHQRKQNSLSAYKNISLSSSSIFQKTTAWEQRKLGEVVAVCSGKDYKHLSEGDIPVYGTGGYMLSVSEALSYFDDAVGIGRKGTIDKPYILKAPFWTVDTLFYAVPKEKMALNFVYCLFQIIDWKSKDESTGVPSLSKIAINSVDISIPKSEEQVRIGTMFLNIDNLITLHQRGEKHIGEK